MLVKSIPARDLAVWRFVPPFGQWTGGGRRACRAKSHCCLRRCRYHVACCAARLLGLQPFGVVLSARPFEGMGAAAGGTICRCLQLAMPAQRPGVFDQNPHGQQGEDPGKKDEGGAAAGPMAFPVVFVVRKEPVRVLQGSRYSAAAAWGCLKYAVYCFSTPSMV